MVSDRAWRLCAPALLSFGLCVSAVTASSTGTSVRFYWGAQVAIAAPDGVRYALVTGDQLALRSGDRFQFYLVPAESAFVYLIHSGPDGVSRLYPEAVPSTALAPGSQLYFPSKTGWFTVDGPPAREHIYLFVSSARLGDLEARLGAHAQAAASSRGPAGAAVLEEVTRLRRLHDPAPTATRPMIPGTSAFPETAAALRSTPSDLAASAAEVKGGAVVVRTFVLEHR